MAPTPGDEAPAKGEPEPDDAEPTTPPPKPVPPAPRVAADTKTPPKKEGVADVEKSDRPLRDSLKLSVGPLTFIPVVLIQAQVLPYVGDDAFAAQGDPADSEGFRLRRGRFGAEIDITDQARARVSFELGSREDGEARIHDAYLAYVGFPYLQAWGGAMTVPFSRSEIAGSESQALTERPLAVRSMAPGQQVGLVARGDVGDHVFTYDAGVFNGFSRTDQFYSGYLQNYAPLGNRFEGLAYVARVATEPVGALSDPIADETHQSPRFGLGASYYYSDGGSRGVHSVEGDALLHAEGFHLLAEALFANVVPKADPTEPTYAVADVKSLGIVAEAGYMIFVDLLGLTARFEYIDSAMGVDDEGDNWVFGGGATVMFFDGMVRSTVEFEHREEMFGLSLANDALIFQAQLAVP